MKKNLFLLFISISHFTFGQVGAIDATIGFVNNNINKKEGRDVKQLSNGHIITCGKYITSGTSFIGEFDQNGNYLSGQTVASPCLYALDTIDASSYIAIGKLTNLNNSLLIYRSSPNANQTVTFNASAQNIEVFDIVTQPDGKFVVCGLESLDGVTNKFFIGRINADLTVDNTFGNNGSVLLTFGNDALARSLVLQQDGKIIIVGHSISNVNEIIVRLNTNGSLDNTFYAVGYLVQTHNGLTTTAELYGVAVGADNTIYTVGKRVRGSQYTLLQWISPAQVLNEIPYPSMENWYTIALQNDSNKVIIGGQSTPNAQGWSYPLVYRYRLNGGNVYEPDLNFNGFNNNGVYSFGPTNVTSNVTFGSYIQKDCKILLSGKFNDKMFITRLNNDFVQNTLGNKEFTINNEFTAYPNPSNGVFNIMNANNLKTIKAFDLIGQEVDLIKVSENTFSLNNKGVYFIQIQTEKNQTVTKRIIIN